MRPDSFPDNHSPVAQEPGIAGPLRIVTHVTADLAACRRFYCGALQMRELPSAGSAEELEALFALQSRLWGLPQGARWRVAHFMSPGLVGVPVIRVVQFEQPGPPIREGFDVTLEGGVAIGFAVKDLALAERMALDQGFVVATHATSVPIYRSDGTFGLVTESVFRAPDEVYAFGIARDRAVAPLLPIAPGFNVGGPAYSSMVANDGQAVIDFLAEVLDYQVACDIVMRGQEPEGVLKLPAGSRMRFVQMYGRAASSGYVALVDFFDRGRANPVPLGPPSRGVALWSFRVRDLEGVLERVRAFAARGAGAGSAGVIAGPLRVPGLFGVQSMASVRAPNGFLIELIKV